MQRFAWVALVLILGLAAVAIIATSGALPATVASHFDGNGTPNGWMPRSHYLVFVLAFALGLPLLTVAIIAWAARAAPGMIKVLNRSRWGAPEHRAEAIGRLTALACWLGALDAALVVGVHFLLLEANAGPSPRLPYGAFVALIGCFALGLLAWTGALLVQFRRPEK